MVIIASCTTDSTARVWLLWLPAATITLHSQWEKGGGRAKERQRELVNRKAGGKAGERRSELMKPPRQGLQGVKHGHCFCLACECANVCTCVCVCPHGLCVQPGGRWWDPLTPGPPNNHFIRINRGLLKGSRQGSCGRGGNRGTWRRKAEDDRLLVCAALQCYCDDEANRVRTATNLGQGCKVRHNNEQNHIVFWGGLCRAQCIESINCAAGNNYFGAVIDCSAFTVSYLYITSSHDLSTSVSKALNPIPNFYYCLTIWVDLIWTWSSRNVTKVQS